MGPSISKNVGDIQQDFMNNITQLNQQNCVSKANKQANGNVFIIQGGNINGDFYGVVETVSTDATCLIVSSMTDSVENILSATLQQTNSAATDMFNFLSSNKQDNTFNIEQSVTNNISQINEATCAASTTDSTSNNYFYVGTGSNIGGNYVGVTDDASASANCSMTNTMKNYTYNQAQATATQSNTVLGMFATFLATFAFIVAIVVIGTVIMFSTGAFKKTGYANAPQLTQEERDLEAARDLGLTPDILEALTQMPPMSVTPAGPISQPPAIVR